MPPAPLPFALLLTRLDGVGRVTAHRLAERFGSLARVRATPREQVLLRLKGAPRAERTVATLFDGAAMAGAEAELRREIEALAPRGVRVLSPGDAAWPRGMDALDRSDRPVALWVYGHLDALAQRSVAVVAHPPLAAAPFEEATRLAAEAARRGLAVATGAAHGFDLAVQKTVLGAGGRVVAVVGAGLAQLVPSMRPGATALVRAGGALVSPFPMPHGPFDHDDSERARVQAALAGATVGVAVGADSPGARALAAFPERAFSLGGAPVDATALDGDAAPLWAALGVA